MAMPVTPRLALGDSMAGNVRFLSQQWFLPSSPLQRHVVVRTNKSSHANNVSVIMNELLLLSFGQSVVRLTVLRWICPSPQVYARLNLEEQPLTSQVGLLGTATLSFLISVVWYIMLLYSDANITNLSNSGHTTDQTGVLLQHPRPHTRYNGKCCLICDSPATSSHWGQTPVFLIRTLREHCQEMHNVLRMF